MENKFTEEDSKRYVEALNFIAVEAKFGQGEPNIPYMIKARNHFAFLQSMASKISDNILEVKKITQPKKKDK